MPAVTFPSRCPTALPRLLSRAISNFPELSAKLRRALRVGRERRADPWIRLRRRVVLSLHSGDARSLGSVPEFVPGEFESRHARIVENGWAQRAFSTADEPLLRGQAQPNVKFHLPSLFA
jgi:hypothetical protein